MRTIKQMDEIQRILTTFFADSNEFTNVESIQDVISFLVFMEPNKNISFEIGLPLQLPSSAMTAFETAFDTDFELSNFYFRNLLLKRAPES